MREQGAGSQQAGKSRYARLSQRLSLQQLVRKLTATLESGRSSNQRTVRLWSPDLAHLQLLQGIIRRGPSLRIEEAKWRRKSAKESEN